MCIRDREEDVRGDLEQLLEEFKTFFCPSALDHALRAKSVLIRVQRPPERIRDYVAAVQKLARHMPRLDEQILKYIVLEWSVTLIGCCHEMESSGRAYCMCEWMLS